MADRDIFGGRPTGQHPNPRMRGRSEGIESLRRPEDFTNLNMLGRPDLSFRYSHIDPSQRGIGTGGSGEMANRPDYFRDDRSIRGTWRMMEDARRADEMDEYGYLEGAPRQRTTFTEGYMDPRSFDEMYGGVYDDAIFRTVDPNTNKLEYGTVPGSVDTNDLGEGFYRSDGEFVEAPLGGFDDRLDSIMSNFPTTYEGNSPGYPNTLDIRYPGDLEASGQGATDLPRGIMETLPREYESSGLWQDIKRILLNTKNPGPLIDQWTDYYNRELT